MIIVIAAFRSLTKNEKNEEYVHEYNRAYFVETWNDDLALRAKLKGEAHSISSSKVISMEMEFNS